MLIQCPSCHARAKISDDHEGAKVRCAECGRVYVARVAGAKGRASRPNTGLLVGGLVGVVALIVVVALVQTSDGGAPVAASATPAPTTQAAPVFDYGWNSPLVRGVAALHEAAFARDRGRVRSMLHGARIWAREHSAADGTPDPAVPAYPVLPAPEREAALERWAGELVDGPGRDLVAEWLPYDGEATEVTDEDATVRVAVRPRAGGIENRWVEWRLAKEGNNFKAWRWERWISPEEAKAEQRKRAKGYEVVTLSDGSLVHERAPEPLAHLADTPPELASKIDGLMATMLDLELTKEAGRAQRELIEIGRPAIPPLLTKLYETPADTEENRIRCNLVDQALQGITGQHFGYAPGEAGSAAGTTEERRQSSIKQWFAWWFKNEKRFTTKKTEDALEGKIELSPEELEWLERHEDE